MALFDALTGASAQRAVKQGQQYLFNGQQNAFDIMGDSLEAAGTYLLGPGGSAASALRDGYDLGRQGLAGGYQTGVDTLANQYGFGQQTLEGQRDAGLGALDTGVADARGDLSRAYGDTRTYLDRVGDLYSPMTAIGQAGANAYADATGANGAEGNARATANFQAGPGYAFTRDEGLGAVMRSAATRGGLAGGNTDTDLAKYASGLADQTYGNYVSRLSPLLSLYGQGAAGQAGALSAQAQAAQGYGSAMSGLSMDYGKANAALRQGYGAAASGLSQGYGSGIANLAQAYGQGNANLGTGLGTGIGGLYGTLGGYNMQNGLASANIYQQTAKNMADEDMQGAKASMQASANFLDTLAGIGSMFTKGGSGGLSFLK